MFVQENIEKLKREWTDKYVVVVGSRPELRRFEGYTGQVKTVNMSGRALVQFDAWSNIGWYDIEPGYLEVVPKPDLSAAGKKVEAKKEAAPKAEAKTEVKPAGGKMSVAEMLAAARANKPTAASVAPAAKPPLDDARDKQAVKEAVPKETVPKPAKPPLDAARDKQAAASGSTALPKGQRPSVEQMLAYCREHDAK